MNGKRRGPVDYRAVVVGLVVVVVLVVVEFIKEPNVWPYTAENIVKSIKSTLPSPLRSAWFATTACFIELILIALKNLATGDLSLTPPAEAISLICTL